MDEIVEREVLDNDGKTVIFTFYREEVKEYLDRYSGLGAVSYYGDTRKEVTTVNGYLADHNGRMLRFKKKNTHEFEPGEDGRPIEDEYGDPMTPVDYNNFVFRYDDNVRVLVTNAETGGVGVNFVPEGRSVALVHDDVARDYTVKYQADDRVSRIGNENYEVRYYNLISKYSQNFLDRMKGLMEDEETGEIVPYTAEAQEEGKQSLYDVYFRQGTYAEFQQRRLDAQQAVFELVMDGLPSQPDQVLFNSTIPRPLGRGLPL